MKQLRSRSRTFAHGSVINSIAFRYDAISRSYASILGGKLDPEEQARRHEPHPSKPKIEGPHSASHADRSRIDVESLEKSSADPLHRKLGLCESSRIISRIDSSGHRLMHRNVRTDLQQCTSL